MNQTLLKTFAYRLTASALAQGLSWGIFRRVEINLIVLGTDLAQMVWYYVFEKLWGRLNRKKC